MKKILSLVFVFTVFASVSGFAFASEPSNKDDNENIYPSQSGYNSDSSIRCTSALIGKQYLFPAGHFFKGSKVDNNEIYTCSLQNLFDYTWGRVGDSRINKCDKSLKSDVYFKLNDSIGLINKFDTSNPDKILRDSNYGEILPGVCKIDISEITKAEENQKQDAEKQKKDCESDPKKFWNGEEGICDYLDSEKYIWIKDGGYYCKEDMLNVLFPFTLEDKPNFKGQSLTENTIFQCKQYGTNYKWEKYNANQFQKCSIEQCKATKKSTAYNNLYVLSKEDDEFSEENFLDQVSTSYIKELCTCMAIGDAVKKTVVKTQAQIDCELQTAKDSGAVWDTTVTPNICKCTKIEKPTWDATTKQCVEKKDEKKIDNTTGDNGNAAAIANSEKAIKTAVAAMKDINFNKSVWTDKEGNFNKARLVSDSVAGVVLGTAGGLITSSIIKKNQTENGFEDISCTVGNKSVAGWNDEFTVGIK